MCGIVGWISSERPIDLELLGNMRDVMTHRGPDGSGIWSDESGHVGLAHRRLSIIDLSTQADQPMLDSRQRATIVFNGEIYNHRPLRRELEAAGCEFLTDHSDTEVLLQGYLHWGMSRLLEKLVGMFAFAVYDIGRQQMHLARDRVGIKPLYWAKVPGGILFSSEIKALLLHPQIKPSLDHDAFRHFLSFRMTSAPRTLFAGIQCVAPSELIEMDVTDLSVERTTWWDPCLQAESPPATIHAARDRLDELIHQSVEDRLESDVPVGLFLSGGVDSGLILQLIRDQVDSLGTYTIGYPGHGEYDESALAGGLAESAKTEHYPIRLSAEDFVESMPHVAYFQDEPIAAPVCTSVYYLSRQAGSTGRKVVLAGEGSDELFIGYGTWMKTRDLQRWNNRLPSLPGRSGRKLAYYCAATLLGFDSRPIEMLRRVANGQPLFWGGSLDFSMNAKQRLLGGTVYDDTFESVVQPIHEQFSRVCTDAHDTTLWMSYIDLRFRLPQLMLPRLDKMGMAFSIEGRVPFLDHRIIEFVFGLPAEWRGGIGRESKPLLKSVARRYLDRDFVDRKKQGFQAPVREWKKTGFGRRYLPLLSVFAERTGLFQIESIRSLVARPNDRLYFSLVNFVLWYSIFIENVLHDRLELPNFRTEPTIN